MKWLPGGYAEMIIEAMGAGDVLISLGFIRVLRLMRILRLTRLLRKTRALRELQKLVRMMATCVRALFWSFAPWLSACFRPFSAVSRLFQLVPRCSAS